MIKRWCYKRIDQPMPLYGLSWRENCGSLYTWLDSGCYDTMAIGDEYYCSILSSNGGAMYRLKYISLAEYDECADGNSHVLEKVSEWRRHDRIANSIDWKGTQWEDG